MNPPAPPFMITGRRLQWLDLSPPLRFARLVRRVRRVGLPPVSGDAADVARYIDTLTDVAGVGVARPEDWRQPELDAVTTLAGYLATRPLSGQTAVTEHYRYRLWVQSRFAALRARTLTPFVALSDWLLGGRIRESLEVLPTAERRGWFMPPCRAHQGRLVFTSLAADLGTEIALSAATDFGFYALVDRGRLTWLADRYPLHDRGFILRSVAASLNHALALDLLDDTPSTN